MGWGLESDRTRWRRERIDLEKIYGWAACPVVGMRERGWVGVTKCDDVRRFVSGKTRIERIDRRKRVF